MDGETVLYDLFLGSDSLLETGMLLEEKNIPVPYVTLDVSDLHSTVYWRVSARDANNITWCTCPFRLTSVFKDWDISFDGFALYQNYPNPFNAETQVTFYLPKSAKVTLKIIDTSGRMVFLLDEGRYGKGIHTRAWNIAEFTDFQLSSGIYILQARLGSKVLHRKMMVVK